MTGERSIRVFVSSTFRDMGAERDELVKQVFPAIRQRCAERDVTFTEVDLRWGVTDEQKAEGAVLPICLAEIDRSRPYFIGLLGQRYGWVPDELPAGLVAELPWLAPLAGTSVTELEILHGVLNDPAAAEHSAFYLRDESWTAAATSAQRAELDEDGGGDEDVAAARRQRLAELRARVRARAVTARDYDSPRRLGELVRADLETLVDRLFPAAEVPDAAKRAEALQVRYAQSLCDAAVDRPSLAARLDAHVDGTGLPLVVAAPPGGGASELVAAWTAGWSAGHPGAGVVAHHARAGGDAADWQDAARRIVAAAGGVVPAADAPPAFLRAALAAAMGGAGSLLVVLDDADLFADADGGPDLTWLPERIAAGVRVVITTTGSRPVTEARRRDWPVLDVPPLDAGERRGVITTFLGRYAKGLDEVHVRRLLDCPAAGNPLYLRTVLDELRQHGDHFTIGALLDRLLAAPDVTALYGRVLDRYAADFERDRPALVGDAFGAIWAARHGLSESELLAVLGDPLPHAVWAPLSLAAAGMLISRDGLLAFVAEPLRVAVQRSFLPDEAARRSAHAGLAAMFARQPLGPRVIDELPWQQLAAGDVDGMVATIGAPPFAVAAHRRDHLGQRRLWARAAESGHRVVDAFADVVEHPERDTDVTWVAARLLTDAAEPVAAARLNRALVAAYRRPDDPHHDRLPAALVNLGAALWLQGQLLDAEAPLREALGLAADDEVVARAARDDLALCLRDLGRLDEADELLRAAEADARVRNDPDGLQRTLGNRVDVLRRRGRIDEALAAAGEQERLCRAAGDRAGEARALAGRAAVLSDAGDHAAAVVAFAAHRHTAAELGDLRGASESGLSEADALRRLGRRDEAAQLAAETEALLRRLDDEPLLARILDLQARMAIEEQRWADAARLAGEAALTARSVGALGALLFPLGSLGTARRELGDLAGARAAHGEELHVAEQLGDTAAAATAHVNLASVDVVAGDLTAALGHYRAAEPALRDRNLHDVLVVLLANRWQVHAHLGDHAAAIADLRDLAGEAAILDAPAQQRDALRNLAQLLVATGRGGEAEPVLGELAGVCRRLGDADGERQALGDQALVVIGRAAVDPSAGPLAERLLGEQERLCRAAGDAVGLAACVGNRAILLRQRGDLAGAMACLDEQLAVARASNNAQGVLFATANRGEVLGDLGRRDEARAALREARSMAAAWGLTPMVTQLDRMLAALS